MMAYLVEHVVPREYYTNMISLTADINILLLMLSIYNTKSFKHLRKHNFELPMVLVELFITIFTTNQTSITELIIDFVLLEGSIVYFKVLLLIFQYFEKEIFKLTEFCMLGA
jgi:Rab-GTPase-TBC domain